MTPIAPSRGPRTDAHPPETRDTADRASEADAARAVALRSILISTAGLLAVMAMILTLTGADPGLTR